MAGTGFSFTSTPSFSLSSSGTTSPSPFVSPISAPPSPFSFSFSNMASTTTSAPSSSPPFGFGASTVSSSSASPTPFGFTSSPATASSASSPLFGSSSNGSGLPPGIFGSASSASTGSTSIFGPASSASTVSASIFGSSSSTSTATSTGTPLLGAASFGGGSATSSPFGASTLFGSSVSSSSSGSTNIFGSGSGSSGGLFGSTAASSPFGTSAVSPATGFSFSGTTSATTSPFSSGLFSSPSSALKVSSSVSVATMPSFPSLGTSASTGSGSAASAPSVLLKSGTSSVSSAPSFASPISSSSAISTGNVSGFHVPSATPAGLSSLSTISSFPKTSSASSASSAPSFSFSPITGSSAASSALSSSFLVSSAPAFSFSKDTGTSAATAVSTSTVPSLSSLSSSASAASSAGFSFGTSGFQTPASATAFSATPASKPGFGTTTSPLFSTVTTTTSASTPAAATTTSASTGITGLALRTPTFGPAASSAATAASTSSGFTGFNVTTSSGTTAAPTSSFSLSTKLPTAGSSTQPQSTAAAPLSGVGDEDEDVQSEGELVRKSVLEQHLLETNRTGSNHSKSSLLAQDQVGKTDFMKNGGAVEQYSESYSVACCTSIWSKKLEASTAEFPGDTISLSTTSVVSTSVIGDTLNIQTAVVDLAKQQSSQDVAEGTEKTYEDSSVVSENHNELSALGEHQGGKSGAVQDVGFIKQHCEPHAVACNTTILAELLEAIASVILAETLPVSHSSVDSALVIGDTPNVQPAVLDMRKQLSNKDVAECQGEASKASSVVSEVGISNAVAQTLSVFSCCSGLTNLTLSPSNGQMIIRSIFDKHGDVTKRSVLKSLVMKSAFLLVVTEVVHRLCNHTMNSLSSDELQLMQSLVDDVAAVGFSVDWLRDRLKKVSAASKCHEHCVHLKSLGEQINAVKKALMEMELQQLAWKKEVDCLKVELEGDDFEGSNLGEGLI